MGYYTYFENHFECSPPLSKEHLQQLNNLAKNPPKHSPGGWMCWTGSSDGKLLEPPMDAGKYRYYEEWLEFLIEKYFKQWEILLNGTVYWFGEERDDMGLMEVKNNVLKVKHAKIIYE